MRERDYDCSNPGYCDYECCVRERRWQQIRDGICTFAVCLGLLYLLSGCVTCKGGERDGCPQFPFVYVPS